MDKESLNAIFNELMATIKIGGATEAGILARLIQWEKATLAYIENKKPVAVSTFGFIGKITGMSKQISTAENVAMRNDLKRIFTQCVIMSEDAMTAKDTPNQCLVEQIAVLTQHRNLLAQLYKQEHITEGTTPKQFSLVVHALSIVATALLSAQQSSAPSLSKRSQDD